MNKTFYLKPNKMESYLSKQFVTVHSAMQNWDSRICKVKVFFHHDHYCHGVQFSLCVGKMQREEYNLFT
jgi:hypothetical protein